MIGRLSPAPSCTLVIFGAAGDLTQRLLLPALYNLRRANLLDDGFSVIGVARAAKDDQAFRKELADSLRRFVGPDFTPQVQSWLSERMSYLRGDFDDAATYEKLSRLLAKTGQHSHGNHLYYLATPPGSFAIIPKCLSAAGLLKEQDGHWRRIIIEKPFGTDLRFR